MSYGHQKTDFDPKAVNHWPNGYLTFVQRELGQHYNPFVYCINMYVTHATDTSWCYHLGNNIKISGSILYQQNTCSTCTHCGINIRLYNYLTTHPELKYQILWNAVASPETLLNSYCWKQFYTTPPSPFFIVLYQIARWKQCRARLCHIHVMSHTAGIISC